MGDQPQQVEHIGIRLEDRVDDLVERVLRARGWVPRVVPHTGYGGPGWVRVLARVILVPPGTRQPRPKGDVRGWRRFFSLSARDVPVTIRIGDREHVVESNREGYVDAVLEHDAEPGWATGQFRVGAAEPVSAPLCIIGADSEVGLVSDIDDTVIVTMLPRPVLAFRNAFLSRERSRRPVPGMADLYAEFLRAHPGAPVVYLSTGAWNTAAALARFLERHGYPAGPLLLTDWGPTAQGWFRSGQEHKRQQLQRLFAELPQVSWLLVGDDGQHDPSLYAEAAAAQPQKVLGIAIRQLTPTEQVATHGSTTPPDDTGPAGRDLPGNAMVGPDGAVLQDHLRRRGLLPP
jgi:phosphatidate phosphatase APP1